MEIKTDKELLIDILNDMNNRRIRTELDIEYYEKDLIPNAKKEQLEEYKKILTDSKGALGAIKVVIKLIKNRIK